MRRNPAAIPIDLNFVSGLISTSIRIQVQYRKARMSLVRIAIGNT